MHGHIFGGYVTSWDGAIDFRSDSDTLLYTGRGALGIGWNFGKACLGMVPVRGNVYFRLEAHFRVVMMYQRIAVRYQGWIQIQGFAMFNDIS